MKRLDSFGGIKPRGAVSFATLLLSFLLITVTIIVLLDSNYQALRVLHLQLSTVSTYAPFSTPIETKYAGEEAKEPVKWHLPPKEEQNLNNSYSEFKMAMSSVDAKEKAEKEDLLPSNESEIEIRKQQPLKDQSFEQHGTKEKAKEKDLLLSNEPETKIREQESPKDRPSLEQAGKGLDDVSIQKNKIVCDYSQQRSDTCYAHGDIRIVGVWSIIFAASTTTTTTSHPSYKIRPYARKWEQNTMDSIKELTIIPSPANDQIPVCTSRHEVPAIVFSTGGFVGNLFHDFTDILIPLYITSREYNGDVRFLVTNFNWQWIMKYQPMLLQLSKYPIIDLDGESRVHCFPFVHVGLKSHKELGIDSSISPNNYSMSDFKEFLRQCFSLKRASVDKRRKPRLLMLLRRGSRSLMNEKEVVSMAKSVGFRVVAARPEATGDVARFARVVNSCDAMMGVHGAGLTNMVFLPDGAAAVQVVPWGELKWACRHDFGEPTAGMGIRYVEYEIAKEESSLIYRYPRDHAVFTDPISIHRQGWNALWSVFLHEQSVMLDVGRFRGVLQEVYQSLNDTMM
ncbi:uncharacterized protein LOC109710901 isoform X3 [Ananas comosus]|uniref:Uncharacterized protein LOC109710901 isoform X3 n=1 Tax=Ananas comosus TaxID=4615 RepID=A0A6P5F0E5_ANACO|nr:uncharacterized protein LOC109710901 isoform X3 [Ananas comosus]